MRDTVPACAACKGVFASMITDMTVGRPGRVLLKFTLPMLLSVAFQQLYTIADSVIVGKFVGEDALAAVGASYPITMLFMAVAFGVNIGCSVVISQLFGAKKYTQMKTTITTSFLSALVIGAVLTVVGIVISSPMLWLLQTPDNVFADAGVYLNIYLLGFLFLFLYNVCTGVFTSLGDSKTPLWFLIGSSLGNVVLDLVFVIVCGWGIAGAAWATFLAQGVSAVLAFLVLMRRLRRIQTDEKPARFSKESFREILRISIPSICQQSFVSVGNLFIQGLVNSFGSSVMAGYSAALRLNTFAITSFNAVANALSSYTAQNIGAQRIDRVKQGLKAGVILAVCLSVPFLVAYVVFGESMVGLFLDTTADVGQALAVGRQFLLIVALFYFAVMIKVVSDGVLRGTGAMRAFMVATFADLLLRVVFAYVLAPLFGETGIWMSWPGGWVIGAVLSCWMVQSELKRREMEQWR